MFVCVDKLSYKTLSWTPVLIDRSGQDLYGFEKRVIVRKLGTQVVFSNFFTFMRKTSIYSFYALPLCPKK